MSWAIGLSFVGVILAPILTWMISRRVHSGQVNNSPAETLWQASESLRNTFKQMLDDAQREIGNLKEQMTVARDEVEHLREEVTAARLANVELIRVIRTTTGELSLVQRRLAVIRAVDVPSGEARATVDGIADLIRELIVILDRQQLESRGADNKSSGPVESED